MLRIVATTKLTPEEATAKAKESFGPDGHGLRVTDETATSVCLEGGGGGVEVSACPEGSGAKVDFLSREWDYQVKEFIRHLT